MAVQAQMAIEMQNPLVSQLTKFVPINEPLLISYPFCPMYPMWAFTEPVTILQTYWALSLLFAYAPPSTWNVLPPPAPAKCQLLLWEAARRTLPVKVSTGALLGRGRHLLLSALKVIQSCFSYIGYYRELWFICLGAQIQGQGLCLILLFMWSWPRESAWWKPFLNERWQVWNCRELWVKS